MPFRYPRALGEPYFRAARLGTRSCSGPRPRRALILAVKLRTIRGQALELALAREVQGGPFPWTPIHGCSKRLDGSDALSLPRSCGPLYLAEGAGSDAWPKTALLSLQVTSVGSPELALRLDWRGTGLTGPRAPARVEVPRRGSR